ncbi:MAG TPA: type IX secretion system membrane protein PorP/SprF [Bacteroidales bacterium]|nr:type IX secretion system membrane protein PorP/SprF [Bacteroidales bacterium]HRS18495.1 type IX secretion system membrane protein PorP/SprF [Bacteroidales bacterium]
MAKIYSYILVILLIGVTHSLTIAQTDIQQTNYMFNELSFNPAYTGSTNNLRATVLARKQWFGFDHSPLTQTLCVDNATRFGGIGLNIINDQVGYERSLYAKLLYSYTAQFSDNTALTAGFAAGVIHRMLDGSQLEFQDETTTDPAAILDMQSGLKPTIDFGLQFLHKDFAIGVSSAHIQTSLQTATIFNMPRHFYGYAQYRIKAGEKLAFVPTVYAKSGSNVYQVEANTNIYFNKKFWLGASYRLDESMVALAGIIIKEQLYIGYAYDFNVGDVSPYSYGSHEIFISFRKKPPTPQSGFYQSTRLFN